MPKREFESRFDAEAFNVILQEKRRSLPRLSALTGISRSYLSQLAHGRVGNPTLAVVVSISIALNRPITDFIRNVPPTTALLAKDYPIILRLNNFLSTPEIPDRDKSFLTHNVSSVLDYLEPH